MEINFILKCFFFIRLVQFFYVMMMMIRFVNGISYTMSVNEHNTTQHPVSTRNQISKEAKTKNYNREEH